MIRKFGLPRLVWLLAVVGLITLPLVACAGPAATPTPSPTPTATATPKRTEWKMGLVLATDPHLAGVLPALDAIYKKTNGQLKITVYYMEELPYQSTDALTVVRDRKLDMVVGWELHFEAFGDFFAAPNQPGLFRDIQQAQAIEDQVIRPTLNQELESKWNATLVTGTAWPQWQVWSTKPINSLADMNGMKIRAIGGSVAELYKRLGITPITVNWGEIQTALQYGTITASATGISYAAAAGWFEVAKYGYNCPFATPISHVIVNKQSLADLPADVRKVFLDEMANLDKVLRTTVVKAEEEKASLKAQALGVKIVQMSASDRATFEALSEDILKGWAAQTGRSEAAKRFAEALLKARKGG